ncbi:MAG: RNase adapter RapZ [Gammaproteobacteria bacterium]|nr:MAG: RNase adapter RapZ [Gammaproteobacteria bacterium]
MRLVVVSGRSGSGKSTALNVLEDVGFTCIDNLPASLLPGLFQLAGDPTNRRWLEKIAVGIDVRNLSSDLGQLPQVLNQLKQSGVDYEVVFLDASNSVLIQRFSETRRKHPLSSDRINISEAIALETKLLDPIASIATRHIDTSTMTLHQLRDVIKKQIVPDSKDDMAILFESFAYKRGIPANADFVLDVRCLPNPHWKQELRPFTGNHQSVIDFLETQPEVVRMVEDLKQFLNHWIPSFRANNRSYLTIAIGCTGGQHRSVYICNELGDYFTTQHPNVQVRHRELS